VVWTKSRIRPQVIEIDLKKPSLSLLLPGLLLFPAAALQAQNDFFNTLNIDTVSRTNAGNSGVNWLGWFTEKVAYGLESPDATFSRNNRALNKIESSLFTQLDWRVSESVNMRVSGKVSHDAIYRFEDDFDYTHSERNEFRNRLEVKDLYLETRVGNAVYLKLGNQILAWGMSEYLRVTDVVNPVDQYTFAQQDLEDLRLQVPAALLSFAAGDWTLDSAVTYRAGYNDMAPTADEFDQWLGFRGPNTVLQRLEPDNEWEYFFRASTHYANGDLQLVFSDSNNNLPGLSGITHPDPSTALLTFSQQRVQTVGVAANFARSNWLLYGETGLQYNQPVTPDNSAITLGPKGFPETDQLLTVVGVQNNAFDNLLLGLEIDSVRLLDHDAAFFADRQRFSFGTRFYWTPMNERLQILGVLNYLASDIGYVFRVSVDYHWTDTFEVGLLWVDYGSGHGSSLLEPFRNNDVLQVHFRYSFQN
jgi:hypothetical protein